MKKILIIEDDQLVANVYRNKLVVEGFQVEVALLGQPGLELVETFRPDLILLDLLLPDVPGVEIMKQLRAKPEFEKLPIIVFSNTYLSNMIKEAWKAGATKCFSKANCTPKQIIEAARSLVGENIQPNAAPAAPQATKEPDQTATHGTPIPFKFPDASKPAARPAAAAPKPVPTGDPAKEFRDAFPNKLGALRNALQIIAKNNDQGTRMKHLDAMSIGVHAFTGGAALPGLNTLAQMADALEALLKELRDKPASINPSSLRTVAHAIDFLETLFRQGSDAKANTADAQILVVDDEFLSRRAVTHALDRAKLNSTDVDDALVAYKLVCEHPYDLIFLDAEMPGMNGFELCAKIRALPQHRKTPVIFVTALIGFDARANSTMAGANDFIAKPFLFVELAVKALTYVLRARLDAKI
jgi:CheY-like chemotaxis protein